MNEKMFEITLQLFSLAIRILISATFISAGYFKLKSNVSWFSNLFYTFDLKETAVTKSCLTLLPWVEILIGSLLFIGFSLKFMAVIGSILMIAFTLFILRAATRSKYVDCGCFGKARSVQKSGATILTRNIVLLMLIFLLYISPFHIWQSEPLIIFSSAMNYYIIVIMLMSIFLFVVFLVIVTISYFDNIHKISLIKEKIHAK